jgi:membrane protein implicated in regulation of membrane protease activity
VTRARIRGVRAGGQEDVVQKLKSEALAVVGILAAIAVGGFVFVTLTMPFVLPAVILIVGALAWRRSRRAKRRAARFPKTPANERPSSDRGTLAA